MEEVIIDLDDKSPLKALTEAWLSFRRTGAIDGAVAERLRRQRAFADELSAEEHLTNETYLHDISSERPSPKALARELWLRCEPVFDKQPEFLEAVRRVIGR